MIHLRELIMQSFVCRPLWTELCQNLWYHKKTTLHWLCTHRFSQFFLLLGLQLSGRSSLIIINAYTIISGLTYLSIQTEGIRYIFIKSEICVQFHLTVVLFSDITDCSRVPPERVAYKKLIKTLKNHRSWLDSVADLRGGGGLGV